MELVENFNEKLNPKDQSVYVLRDKNEEIRYVGRTNDTDRREYEHKNNPKHPERANYDMFVVQTGLSKTEARVAEQMLISAYGMEYLDNLRREIAVSKIDQFRQYITRQAELQNSVSEDELREMMFWR